MPRSSILMVSAMTVALLPAVGLAQTASPAAAPGPAPSAGGAPAEVMPPAARTGKGGSSSPAAAGDAIFVNEARSAGLMEVRMGRLAEQQALAMDVRAFGQHMVTDHTELNEKLDTIALKEGLKTPVTSDPKDNEALADLAKQHGAAFDHAYVQGQIADHQSAVALYQREAASGSDPALKKFATDALPTLRQHLEMAQAAEGK
jgi:putative membrane protein